MSAKDRKHDDLRRMERESKKERRENVSKTFPAPLRTEKIVDISSHIQKLGRMKERKSF